MMWIDQLVGRSGHLRQRLTAEHALGREEPVHEHHRTTTRKAAVGTQLGPRLQHHAETPICGPCAACSAITMPPMTCRSTIATRLPTAVARTPCGKGAGDDGQQHDVEPNQTVTGRGRGHVAHHGDVLDGALFDGC